MCGIVGYIGKQNPISVCLFGLKQLEYRGYDSSGIAGIAAGAIRSFKHAGKIVSLEEKLQTFPWQLELAIGHTRWATHGKQSDENAHPHLDSQSTLALIHNGIIENYASLREGLQQQGIVFLSETDTEVIVHLISQFYKGDLLIAVQKALCLLKGSFAIALIHQAHPTQMIVAARESPLCIGFNAEKTESIISSDPNAMLPSTKSVLFLRRDEIARVEAGSAEIFNLALEKLPSSPESLDVECSSLSKEGFPHYMLKEIFEQPATVKKALLGRMNDAKGLVEFEYLRFTDEELRKFRNILLIGCGTSAHAGQLATLLFEDLARIPASSELASEARYRNLILTPDTLVIALSQSGETADTLAAMREVKRRGCSVLGICNVKNSALSRETDSALFMNAGPEISVCSTKAFSSQITILALFALHLARLHGMSKEDLLRYFSELKKIPAQIQQVLDCAPALQALAKKYAQYDDFFFMGRRYMVPTCLEAALKLKEVSYVNANGIPAGELKHGLIALIHERFPVVAFCANMQTEEKMASNLMQVKARGAPILAFVTSSCRSIPSIADDLFLLPATIDPFAPFLSTVAGQLLAYYIAKERGCDIDQPRNLAKSVTVE